MLAIADRPAKKARKKSADRPLVAYTVHDGNDQTVAVFATNSATARREGAGEMDTDWEGVDYCKRERALDQYAPGPVPPLALIDCGWWIECSHCERRISSDMHEDLEADGEDPADYVITERGRFLFCSKECCARDYQQRRARKAAEAALIELVETKFPGSKVTSTHVSGYSLEETPEKSLPNYARCSAYFTFPGGSATAKYVFPGPVYVYGNDDVAAFDAAYQKSNNPSNTA